MAEQGLSQRRKRTKKVGTQPHFNNARYEVLPRYAKHIWRSEVEITEGWSGLAEGASGAGDGDSWNVSSVQEQSKTFRNVSV